MDLASGYSDSINYGNGYTPLANNAIANNNADYLRNQLAMQQAGQYDPFAQSGGFGAMTNAYSGAGAAYGRATGGFNAAPQQSVFDTGASAFNPYGVDNAIWSGMSAGDRNTFNQRMGGGIGSDAARAPNQPAITPQQTYVGGYNPYDPGTYGPSVQQNVGGGGYGSASSGLPGLADTRGGGASASDYANIPSSIYTGDFSGANRGYTGFDYWNPQTFAPTAQQNVGNPYASMPWWSTFERSAGPQGAQDWLKQQGVGGGAAPAQPQPQPQQQQPNSLPPFWQGMRDMFGADPKDQSRIPQSSGGYPGATNPNYQPGGMDPQQSVPYLRDTWTNAS